MGAMGAGERDAYAILLGTSAAEARSHPSLLTSALSVVVYNPILLVSLSHHQSNGHANGIEIAPVALEQEIVTSPTMQATYNPNLTMVVSCKHHTRALHLPVLSTNFCATILDTQSSPLVTFVLSASALAHNFLVCRVPCLLYHARVSPP